MFAKKEGRQLADGVQDGQHCDLCGCTNPAVRCDKCNSQIFCLSCDDMYHRHPKRRTHLRKAVDSFNPHAVRPVTPNKPPPGDPSKMPIPPPRKKKPRNFFGTLMRASSPNQSPVLPKKEFSWIDKFGTIKRFMSNRPLPPLPVESSPSPEPVGTIYQNVPDTSGNRPPEPVQTLWSSCQNHQTNGTDTNSESDRRPTPPPKHHQFPLPQTGDHPPPFTINRVRGNSVGELGKWGQGSKILPNPTGNRHATHHPGTVPNYATFRKLSAHSGLIKSRSPSPSPTHDGSTSIHQSASLTDLNSLPTTPGPYPYYPHHSHQPYLPMFPAHSYAHLNCPQCYMGTWTQSLDNCEYCHSSNDSNNKHSHHPLGSKVKRSQSVMYDNMNNPVPYFPFAPGYGPFFPHGHHLETPPSPTSSARSLQNTGRQPQKHNIDDNVSVTSSTRSRGKSTSSGQQKSADNESMEISTDDEEEEEKKKNHTKQNLDQKELEKTASTPLQNPLKPWMPNEAWSCEYCTYINPPRTRICTICCKTISNMGSMEKTIKEEENSGSQKLNSSDYILESVSSPNSSNLTGENNVSQLKSALEEAEKEMNKEFSELMRVKNQTEEKENKEESSEKKTDEVNSLQTTQIQYCEIAIGTDNLTEQLENKSIYLNTLTTEKKLSETSTPVTSALNNIKRRDSSCQTYDNLISETNVEQVKLDSCATPLINEFNENTETRTVSLGTSPINDISTQFYPERNNLAGMRRSLSRLSLNYGPRQSEFRQQPYQNQEWPGYGEPLYRSISQSSLIGEADMWSPDLRRMKKPDYYLSIEELVERRRQEAMRAQGLEIVRMIREAEQKGFTADDLQIALNNCGKSNPVEWLENNWKNMVKTVVTLATNYGHDKKENDIGIVSSTEAREALKIHKGNIWAAVTECVESRQRKYLELSTRGNFSCKKIVAALTSTEGNVEMAYAELTKATLKPFLMRIWGPGSGVENESASMLPQSNNLCTENIKHTPTERNFPQKEEFDFDLDNDYAWNDSTSEYDNQQDNKSNDDDYEYENNYNFSESNYQYDNRNGLILQNQDTNNKQKSYKKFIDSHSQETHIDNTEKKDETKKNQSSGFLNKLASFKKANKNNIKYETGTKDTDNFTKDESILMKNSTKLQKEILEDITKEKFHDENLKKETTEISSNDADEGMTSVENSAINEISSEQFAQIQMYDTKKNSERKNSSLSNLLKHFSSEKQIASKSVCDNLLSKSSTKNKSFSSDEILEKTEKNLGKDIDNFAEKLIKPTQNIEEKYDDNHLINDDMNTSKDIINDDKNITKNVTQKPLDDNTLLQSDLNNTQDKKKEVIKDTKTGAISKNIKKSDTSVIGKTIGKFNFMGSRSSFNKRSTDNINPAAKKQTENITSTHNKTKENYSQNLRDENDKQNELAKCECPKSKMENIKNSDDKKGTNKDYKEERKSPDIKTERTNSSLDKNNIVNKLSGEKLESKNLTKKETGLTVISISPKKEEFIGKKRMWIPSLQKPNEKQLIFERKVRRLLAEEKCTTYEKAEIAVKLIEMNFNEDDVVQAMQDCSTLDQAFTYLQQECELCVGIYPANKMVSMIHCIHRACRDCLTTYFTIQIRDRNIRELMCPYCNEPDLDNEDIAMDYFNHLDIMLKKLVEPDIHELFQQKLRDRVLMKDPNFHWCSQCSSGFIAIPDLKKLICPDCKAITCAQCRRLWEKQHDDISCEQFIKWKEANDPEAQAAGLAKHLTDNGIDCPNCKFRYSLAKGGCMHFRCIQCQYDFCSGCGKPFKMGQKCTVSDFCAKLGLHAHHPRNCLFYLRDKEPADLQKLLDENNISYNREPSEGTDIKNICHVMEQKETPQGMKDDICGKEVEEEYAGLCRLHFIEYLVSLINRNFIDPLPILDLQDMQLVLRRGQIPVPQRDDKEVDQHYKEKLIKLIQENLPLERPEGS